MSYRPPASGNSGPPQAEFEPIQAAAVTAQPKARPVTRTDFDSLGGARGLRPRIQHRSLTDWIIDVLTPILIFVMIDAVVSFLLDVRYVYTAVHDSNLRMVAFFFTLGIVALNRLIARDGSQESYHYFIVLAGVIALYTMFTTSVFGVGSVARNFLNDAPFFAIAFNMVIVVFFWWLVNRLTHECCVDENKYAGDVGMLRGTAIRVQRAIQRAPEPVPVPQPARHVATKPWDRETATQEATGARYHMNPFDPTTDHQKEDEPEKKVAPPPLKRLPKRHPGISILYFSVPVLFIFSVGLPVIRHGGERWVRAGMVYMGIYCVCALMLLMLTSLAGIREFFRRRNVRIPGGLGPFWLSLGTVMIAMVLTAALQLPLPPLPEYAAVDEHKIDVYAVDQVTLKIVDPASLSDETVQRTNTMVDYIGRGVLAILGLFLAYAALRAVGAYAAQLAQQRDKLPRFVIRFFDWLDRFLQRTLRLPHLPNLRGRVRIQRSIATSARYQNLMGNKMFAANMTVPDHVAHAYEALCALAYDLGVPRKPGQTPYEFLQSFPEALSSIQEEAHELTMLFVQAAYSPDPMDIKVTDRLRKFWIMYNRVRNRCLR